MYGIKSVKKQNKTVLWKLCIVCINYGENSVFMSKCTVVRTINVLTLECSPPSCTVD